MEKESIALELPKVALKWLDKIALNEGKSLEAFLVDSLMHELSVWLLDEDNQVLPELAMMEIIDDGLVDVLNLHDCCLWNGDVLRDYASKKAERLAASQSKTALADVSKT